MFEPVWRHVVGGAGQPALSSAPSSAVSSAVSSAPLSGLAARLNGFRRHAIRGETYPAVIAQAGASVTGVLYPDVSDADIVRLDAFEGSDYQRVRVSVDLVNGSGNGLAADTYLWLDASRLEPQDWDVQWFEREGIHRFLAEYCGISPPGSAPAG